MNSADSNQQAKTPLESAKSKPSSLLQAVTALLKKSGLFSEGFYLEENNLTLDDGEEAIVHFLAVGAAQGLKPHPIFDPAFYLSQVEDQAEKAQANPVLDYLAQRNPNADPSPLFSTRFYLSQNPTLERENEPPLVHFLREGSRKGLRSHPLFDSLYYASHSQGWRQRNRQNKTEPLSDFLRYGAQEATNPHPLFDAAYYRKSYMAAPQEEADPAEIGSAEVNPLVAYLCRPEGVQQSPHPLFDVPFYLETASAPLSHSPDPLIDFLSRAEDDDCSPHLFFDIQHYRSELASQKRKAQRPLLLDFLSRGEGEGLNPNPLFDVSFYQEKYSEALVEGANSLVHFVAADAKNNFWPNALFDPQHYLSVVTQLDANRDCSLRHYLLHGCRENGQTHLLFDNGFYLRQLEDEGKEVFSSPLADFLANGTSSSLSPHPFFDNPYYCLRYPEVVEAEKNPLIFFLEQGSALGHQPHPLFDSAFYLAKNPDLLDGKVEPLQHYLTAGGIERRWPNQLFDPDYYLGRRPDVAQSKTNPLFHYIDHGEREGSRPHPLFDPQYYREQLPDGLDRATNALSHYISTPDAWTVRPHPLFDPVLYQANRPGSNDDKEAKKSRQETEASGPMLVEYLQRCEAEEIKAPCRLFDEAYYLRNNEDLAKADVNLFLHYVTCGEEEGRRPHPLFDPQYYKNTYPIARVTQGQGPLADFFAYGMAADHNPCALFDVAFYQRQLKGTETKLTAIEHYLTMGHQGDFDPNAFFSNALYAENYPWCREQNHTPLGHYIEWGESSGLLASERFSADYYLGRNPSVGDPKAGALTHFLINGRYHDLQAMPPRAWCERYHTRRSILARLQKAYGQKPSAKVSISIVIPVFNQLDYTLHCLAALADSNENLAYEIILVDDASSDDTAGTLQQLPGIRYVKNAKNQGFIKSCNRGAAKARGEFLVFLNNDTAVKPGWLSALRDTFDRFPTAGLVGAKLLYPNGLLQEAGGICWEDGSAANFGNRTDPDLPEYNYARDVDYISGAAIMLPKSLFLGLGGFDERYLPAYYEDADLAFKVREKGYRVIYQPLSEVVHFEGITSGRDINKGAKKHQLRNKEVFRQAWAQALQTQGQSGDFSEQIYDRKSKPKLLIIDACTPTPDRDSGSLSALYYQEIFLDLGYQVTFIPCSNLQHAGSYTAALQKQGVKCLHFPYITSVDSYLEDCDEIFDLVLLYRVKEGGAYIETVRKHQPNAKVIFDTTDLHYLREERQAELFGDGALKDMAAETKARELSIMRQADATILVSEFERELVSKEQPGTQIEVISLALEQPGSQQAFNKRKDICFVGGYQHTPNVDAAIYLVDEIWPLIKQQLPKAKCYLVGSNAPKDVINLASEDIIVTGYVEDLGDYLDQVKLTVVPLRFGAGVKGKIGSSLSYGVPCVSSPVGVEGMGLVDGKNIAIAEDPQEFADKVVELYRDQKRWNQLSQAGLEFAEAEFSINTNRRRLEDIAAYLQQPLFYGRCDACGQAGSYEVLGWPIAQEVLCKSCGASSEERLLAKFVAEWVAAKEQSGVSPKEADPTTQSEEIQDRRALPLIGQLNRTSKGHYEIRPWGAASQPISDGVGLNLLTLAVGPWDDLDLPVLLAALEKLPTDCEMTLALCYPRGLGWKEHAEWRQAFEGQLAVLQRHLTVEPAVSPDGSLLGVELWHLRPQS